MTGKIRINRDKLTGKAKTVDLGKNVNTNWPALIKAVYGNKEVAVIVDGKVDVFMARGEGAFICKQLEWEEEARCTYDGKTSKEVAYCIAKGMNVEYWLEPRDDDLSYWIEIIFEDGSQIEMYADSLELAKRICELYEILWCYHHR